MLHLGGGIRDTSNVTLWKEKFYKKTQEKKGSLDLHSQNEGRKIRSFSLVEAME